MNRRQFLNISGVAISVGGLSFALPIPLMASPDLDPVERPVLLVGNQSSPSRAFDVAFSNSLHRSSSRIRRVEWRDGITPSTLAEFIQGVAGRGLMVAGLVQWGDWEVLQSQMPPHRVLHHLRHTKAASGTQGIRLHSPGVMQEGVVSSPTRVGRKSWAAMSGVLAASAAQRRESPRGWQSESPVSSTPYVSFVLLT
jgi:hypothetical protein